VRFARRPSVVFLALLVLAAAAPGLARYDPMEMNKVTPLALPSWSNPMGTDQFGRDILSRLLYGARVALAIGLLATAGAAALGVPLGLWAGCARGRAGGVREGWCGRPRAHPARAPGGGPGGRPGPGLPHGGDGGAGGDPASVRPPGPRWHAHREGPGVRGGGGGHGRDRHADPLSRH